MLLGFLALLMPPISFIFIMLIILVTVGVLLLLKALFKVKKEDLSASFFRACALTCLGEIMALYVTLFVASAVSLILPVINEVNNEWWPNAPHAHLAMVLFLQMWIFLYFISRMILFVLFKKTFRDKSKSSLFTIVYLISTSVLWFSAGLLVFR